VDRGAPKKYQGLSVVSGPSQRGLPDLEDKDVVPTSVRGRTRLLALGRCGVEMMSVR
jgi:hypothetical protein